jgi:hypothetical protein
VIWVRREGKYFCKRGWTGKSAKHELICPSGSLRAKALIFSSWRCLSRPYHLACPIDQRGQGAKLRAIVRLALGFTTLLKRSLVSSESERGQR